MSLGYQKWTKDEDLSRNVMNPGEYIAFVEDIKLEMSKGGLDKNGKEKQKLRMFVLDLLVTDGNRERKIKDWVIIDGEMSWKLRHLAVSCGLEDKYEDGTLEQSDIYKQRCTVKVGVKDSQDQNGLMVKRNYIVDYLEEQKVEVTEEFKDSELPF
jgi:hypothetical protein